MTQTSATDFYALDPDAQVAAMQQLAEAALARWPGPFTEIKLVKYRENAVFSARHDNNRRVALRIHRHGYHSLEALRSELEWMRALDQAGISAPKVLPNRAGEYLTGVSHPAVPEERMVDLLDWLPGEPVGSAEDGVATSGDEVVAVYEAVGALAARVHNHSSSWPGAAQAIRHHWDEAGLIGPEPFWGRFWEMPGLSQAQRALLERATAKAAQDLRDFGHDKDRYGLIHADFVPENLLFDGHKLSLIDFDDCGFGWHMFELATALIFLINQPNYDSLKGALFRGYRQTRPLPADHEALLPLFLFLRGTTYLGWVQTRSETQTAIEMAPMMIEMATQLASEYLAE